MITIKQAQDKIKAELLTKAGKLNSAIVRRETFKSSELYQAIITATAKMKLDTTFAGRVYSILADVPVCPVCCERPLGYFNRLLETCGEQACISSVITERRLLTLNKLYGAGVSIKAREASRARASQLNSKGRERLLAEHGVTNAFQLPSVRANSAAGSKKRWEGFDSVESRAKLWEARFNVEILDIIDKDSSFVKFKCRNCLQHDVKTFYALVHRQKMAGDVCSQCGGYAGGSIEQRNLYDSVKLLAPDAILNDRQQITPLELDIFIPSKKLAIEYHGIFWHTFNGSVVTHDREKHLRKHNACVARGIRLLQFTSLDNQACMLGIIKHSLGLNERLYARKLIFNSVDQATAIASLTAWHLEPEVLSCKHAFGLFNGEELVQVATFGAPRFESSSSLELYRLASKPGLAVIGGVSKLITNAKKELNASSIVTYASKFLGGNGYLKAGGTLIGDTKPGYFYYHPKTEQVISRYSAQKHKLQKLLALVEFNESLTEREHMLQAGYRIFYTAGNYKYLF